jgi:hypothetical protein
MRVVQGVSIIWEQRQLNEIGEGGQRIERDSPFMVFRPYFEKEIDNRQQKDSGCDAYNQFDLIEGFEYLKIPLAYQPKHGHGKPIANKHEVIENDGIDKAVPSFLLEKHEYKQQINQTRNQKSDDLFTYQRLNHLDCEGGQHNPKYAYLEASG